MSNSRVIKRGDVFYVTSKFDTIGSEQKSGRPAVIVSNDSNNCHSECVEICYLTLKAKTPLPTHIIIPDGPCFSSTILCEQITTVSVERLGDFMCHLDDDTMSAVDKALRVSLGIPVSDECTCEEYRLLKEEFSALSAQREESRLIIDDLKKKAEMYERMYNDILDRMMRVR